MVFIRCQVSAYSILWHWAEANNKLHKNLNMSYAVGNSELNLQSVYNKA